MNANCRVLTAVHVSLRDSSVREVRSTQRRRRLRLIQAEDARTARKSHAAVSALATAADIEVARAESEVFQQRLLVECRARSHTKLRVETPGADPLTITLDRPNLLVGSDPGCDLILDHEDVAAHHSFLQWVDGEVFWCDIAPRPVRGLTRHSPLNGQWLIQNPIAIGPYQLVLEADPSSTLPDYSPLDRSPRLVEDFPQFALQFKGVEQRDNQWPVNRVLTMIGCGIQCKLRLNHPSMPIVQACLLRTKSGCWLFDVAGAGTTGVNGRMIGISPIDIGDELQLGPFHVEVVTAVFEPIENPPKSKSRKRTAKPLSPVESNDVTQRGLNETPAEAPLSSSDGPVDNSLPISSITPAPEGVPLRETATAVADSDRVDSRLEAMDSLAGIVITPVPDVDPRLAAASVTLPALLSSDVDASDVLPTPEPSKAIVDFIHSQQTQLAILKSRIEQVIDCYGQASGRLISKRMKSTLDKSIQETLQSHATMTDLLAGLIDATNLEHSSHARNVADN